MWSMLQGDNHEKETGWWDTLSFQLHNCNSSRVSRWCMISKSDTSKSTDHQHRTLRLMIKSKLKCDCNSIVCLARYIKLCCIALVDTEEFLSLWSLYLFCNSLKLLPDSMFLYFSSISCVSPVSSRLSLLRHPHWRAQEIRWCWYANESRRS